MPDTRSQNRIDARRRLVEDEQRRLVDHRAGELQATLHAARHLRGAPIARIPQVDEAQDFLDSRAAPPRRYAKQRGDKVDVLPGGQIGIEHEQLGHVANRFARPAPKVARILAKNAYKAAVRIEAA